MDVKTIVKKWFDTWEEGSYRDLPISEHFKHTSPFGTIDGRKRYLALVEENKDKFLGQRFELHDEIYERGKACVRYTAKQGDSFRLDVSEWYYMKDGLIEEIVAYYHIGEIRDERKLQNPDDRRK
jgi:hypothetical protein